MRFVIFGIDRPGKLQDRMDNLQAHRDYVDNQPLKVVLSGPLMDDAGEKMVGSLYVIEADTREQAEQFYLNDPLHALDVWASVEVAVFNKRVGWNE